MKKDNDFIIVFIALLCGLTLNAIYDINQLVDDFGYSAASLARIYIGSGHVMIEPLKNASGFFVHNINSLSYRPLSSLLICELSLILSVSPENLIYLPITGFTLFLLVIIILKNRVSLPLAATVALLGINVANSVTLGSTFYYISIGMTLFFTSFFLLIRFLEKQDKSDLYLAIMIALISSYVYYTASYLILASSLIIYVYITLKRIRKYKSIRIRDLRYIALVALIAFLNEVTPYRVIDSIAHNRFETSKKIIRLISSWMFKILGKAGGYTEYKGIFTYYGMYADIAGKIFLISFGIIALFAALAILIAIISGSRRTYEINETNKIIAVTFFILMILHFATYSLAGEPSPMIVWISIPLVAVTLLHKTRFRTIILILLMVALASGFVKQYIFAIDNTYMYFFDKVKIFSYYLAEFSDARYPLVIFIYHNMDAKTTFLRVELSNCGKYPRHILLISEHEPFIEKYLADRYLDIAHAYHKFASLVRIGTLGLEPNIFIKKINEFKVEYFIPYNDGLNILIYIPRA